MKTNIEAEPDKEIKLFRFAQAKLWKQYSHVLLSIKQYNIRYSGPVIKTISSVEIIAQALSTKRLKVFYI